MSVEAIVDRLLVEYYVAEAALEGLRVSDHATSGHITAKVAVVNRLRERIEELDPVRAPPMVK